MSYQLPIELIESLQDVPGFDEQDFLQIHQSGEQATSIRINPAKVSQPPASLPVAGGVPWCQLGYYLSERPSFTFDPVFHGGTYYVQDASSMFLHHVVNHLYQENVPNHVLDLCGAPGGKSTLLAAALPNSFLVCNEVIKSRVTILAENISKWGSENVVVTNNDPKDFSRLPGFFDLVVIDAPCSGSGLFRKDPSAIEEWSEASVSLCSQRQQRILADTIGVLRQDGYLIYSTCSYSKQENEDICDWIVSNFNLATVQIPIKNEWGIVETKSEKEQAFGYRFYPGKVKGEGFFIACFRQPGVHSEYYQPASKPQLVSKKELELIEPWINEPGNYHFIQGKEVIIATPKKWADSLTVLQKNLGIRKSGVAIGSLKGKDLVPHHELALSSMVNKSIHRWTVNETDALKYLRRQDLAAPGENKGWALVSHNDIGLGWVKILPNRVNNYYPTNWRILKP